MDKTAYAPGESGVIKAYFKSGNFSGPVTKSIRVTSNTIGNKPIRLSFTANVVSDLKPSTTSLFFRDVMPGNSYTKQVFIQNNMEQPLVIGDVKINGDPKIKQQFPMSVSLTKNEEGLEYLVFDMKSEAGNTVMRQANYSVDVHTNSAKSPVMTFYIILRMQQPIEIQPTSLFLFGVKAGQKRVRRIQIKSNIEKFIRVKDIRCEASELAFDTIAESDTVLHIWVGTQPVETGTDTAAGGNFTGVIHIDLLVGDNEEKTFSIPVKGSILP